MDSVEIAEALAAFPDDVFFGPDLLGFVANARANPPSPLDLAGYVLQGRQYVLAQEKPAPMAMELLLLGHLDVLVDRLVPEAPENYRHETVKALQALLDAEAPIAGANGDGDDDEEEEEGEEEGSAETEEETAN